MSDFEDWYANINGMLQCLRGIKYNIEELQSQTRSILSFYPLLKRGAPKYRHQEAYDELLRVLSVITDDLEWDMKRAKKIRDKRKALKDTHA